MKCYWGVETVVVQACLCPPCVLGSLGWAERALPLIFFLSLAAFSIPLAVTVQKEEDARGTISADD